MLRMRIFRTLMLVTLLAAPALALSACNTMEGAGRDIERAGEWTQEKAK